MGAVAEYDRRLFGRLARSRRAVPGLRRLSRAADHGVLWAGVAGALAVSGDRTARRAALRGMGALGLASAAANVAAKAAVRRPRPLLDEVPLVRQLLRQPLTSSFPSGHAASAAAFATGVAIESPVLGLLVAPVAAAVAASRVYVGVHYPSDVLAGAALGGGLALLTLRWWPRRSDAPAAVAPPGLAAPALPGGRGLTVVVNPHSGQNGLPAPVQPEPVADQLRELLPEAEILVAGPEEDLADLVKRAVEQARGAGGALGVCGGDGTVNLAATAAHRAELPLAVFPGGTLNHFAADLGVPDLRAAAEAVESGSAVGVDLAMANDGEERAYFLNTFSIGIYPELVRVRERHEKRLGKWPALALALAEVLRSAEPTHLSVSGVPRTLWLLFAGNGRYEPAGFAPTHRGSLADGRLDIRAVDGSAPFARTRLLAAFLTGTLGTSRVYREARLTTLDLTDLRGVTDFSVDGEVRPAPERLRLTKPGRPLTVYRPSVE
ncbi:phosphoesterase [Kitasatospora sp. MMS16-BH015]|uniref:bifunctional phosphatase PAP2/diacylglycerol kinase family protein n=1 Tax=Kitasatospora sp. MMS16-BH015 TaxID=2018025 RepID=UPI000CA1E557|nr:phosphatase PAP2 family protein [Kitasatospora sp. MMS16-BH015]AUG82187.1 phosphoesterase [Kitasatospora sp. MMS16-BH015]